MKKLYFILSLVLFVGLSVFADGNDQKILQISEDCKKETGASVTINSSGRRTVRRQAELMAAMTDSQLDWYGSSTWYVVEMKNIPRNMSGRVEEFELLINKALKQGSFVSRHLKADAVDIAPSTSTVRDYLEKHGVSIKDETVDGNKCWHLQLK
jgi:hypothetical protein